jgi:hypothetical protein
MFAQKEETLEETDPKAVKTGAKGKQAPQKDGKEGKKKGKWFPRCSEFESIRKKR